MPFSAAPQHCSSKLGSAFGLHEKPREESPSVAPASLGKHLATGLETLQVFTS